MLLLFLALGVRLALIPITLHGDLLFVNYFPHFLSLHGIWDVYGYFGDHYLTQEGITYYPPLVYYAIAFSQWITLPFNPGFEAFMAHAHRLFYSKEIYTLADYLKPFSEAKIFQFNFFMKLPYLIAEGGCLWALGRIVRNPVERQCAFYLWLFNPVVIFSSYIFGQYRMLSAFLMFLVILFIREERRGWACFTYGCICLMENYALLFMPFAVLLLGGDLRERFKAFCVMFIPIAAVLLPLSISSNGYVLYSYLSPRYMVALSSGIIRHYPQVVNPVSKAIFFLCAGGLFVDLWKFRKKQLDPAASARLFSYSFLVFLLAHYATSITLVHYFIWAMPFFVLVQSEKEPWNPLLSWVLMGLLFLFNLDQRMLNAGLLAPLGAEYFLSLPSLHEIMERLLPWGRVIGLARLVFSGLCLFFMWRLWRDRVHSDLGNV